MNTLRIHALAALAVTTILSAALAHAADLRQLVQADWETQEQKLGRSSASPEALAAALARAQRLLADLRAMPGAPDLATESRDLQSLQALAANPASLDQPAIRSLYHRTRWLIRAAAFKNPLLADKPLVFMQRKRFACQMLHEYLAYYNGDFAGGGVFLLKQPGLSLDTRELIAGRLPEGIYTTLSLSYDAKTLYFAFAEKARPKPDFYRPRPTDRYFHIFAMDADGSNLRQLTDGPADDFDPCPLPDGGIAFMSWRRGGGFIRCSGNWEPIPAYTLHRMDPDGRNIRTLSFHETNEWHPSVLNDGRIAYIRWDYVDRSAANYHGIWVTNPDGTNPASLFGNYTETINACYQPRAIPGSHKIVFLAGAHHADVGGSLVILDPHRAQLDRKTGKDQLDAVERLSPEICFPESQGWPDRFFHSPWPLSENYFLVSFGFHKLPGMSSGNSKDAPTGLYYFDRFGNLELLYRSEGIASMYPIPLAPRPRPPVIASALDKTLADEGEYFLTDVRQSLLGLPTTRPITHLRVWQVLPKTTHEANEPRIGHANAESARMLLGTVPVEPDGSAYFRAPARKPVYFQAVDDRGVAVQTMRSITYLQPGERRGCVGCHEPAHAVASPQATLAMKKAPARIQPGPDGTRPFSYVRLVQPVLDRHCVTCHDGAAGPSHSKLLLTGQPVPKSTFSQSYQSLRPFVRWYEWGGESIDQAVSRPGHGGAIDSPLVQVLQDPNHRNLKLDDADRLRLHIWLDGNVPFYGVYEPDQQRKQKLAQIVPEPQVQ